MTTVEPIKNKQDIEKIRKILLRQNFRDYILFNLGINSGLRVCDILNLDVKDVKNKHCININEKKTKKFKKILLNSKIKNLLEKFVQNKKPDEPLFKTYRNNRLDRITVYHIIKDACKEAGIKENIGTHTLRKTFGYHHYRKFNNIALLQKIFNHASIEVTLRYIGINQEEIDSSYNNFIL